MKHLVALLGALALMACSSGDTDTQESAVLTGISTLRTAIAAQRAPRPAPVVVTRAA